MNKVAIITRTKDRPLFLKRAIESVSRQSYGEYVHVIVNDGGDRRTLEAVIEAVDASTKKKIRLFHRDGPSDAPDTIFNESINRVDSELIALHDDDDSWHEDFLKTTVRHLETNPVLGGVVVRADKIIERIDGGGVKTIKRTRWMPDIKVISLYRQHVDNQLTPIAFLFRRSAYIETGGFDDTLPVIGDWEFGIRFLKKFDVDFIDPGYALANYHHRQLRMGVQGNTSFAGNDLHRYYSNLVMNRYLRAELENGTLGSGYMMSSLRYRQASMAAMLKRLLPSSVVDRIKKRLGN